MHSGYKLSNKLHGEIGEVGTNDQNGNAGNKSSTMRPVVFFEHCWRGSGYFRMNICRRV